MPPSKVKTGGIQSNIANGEVQMLKPPPFKWSPCPPAGAAPLVEKFKSRSQL